MRVVTALASILAMGLMMNSEKPTQAGDFMARGAFFTAILSLKEDHKFVLTIADHNVEVPRKHYEETGTWELSEGAVNGISTLCLETDQVLHFRIEEHYVIKETLLSKTRFSRRLPFLQTGSNEVEIGFRDLKQKYELQNSLSESTWLKFENVDSQGLWHFKFAKDHKTHTF